LRSLFASAASRRRQSLFEPIFSKNARIGAIAGE
jgi:hypothetical protein